MTVRHLVSVLCAASAAHFAFYADAAVPVEESVAEERANRTEVSRPPATRTYEAPAIDPGIDEALTEFITKKKDSMPDAFV